MTDAAEAPRFRICRSGDPVAHSRRALQMRLSDLTDCEIDGLALRALALLCDDEIEGEGEAIAS